MDKLMHTERGWGGHFIGGSSCLFRRNTLLEYKDKKWVVSTVGNFISSKKELSQIGLNRYYETMAFESDIEDKKYHDADVSKQITFDSEWSINFKDMDNEANVMHETVVNELSEKIMLVNR